MFPAHGILALAAWLLATPAAVAASAPPDAPDASSDNAPPAAATPSEPSPPQEIGLVEDVEVTGRLGAARPSPASPATHALGGDALATRGARSLPEALASEPGVQAVDQVGNGRQLSLDLRGFAGGDGATAFLVDGVRMNDPDTNAAAWETVRLEDVERVTISPGPRGATLGGGSLGGAIEVVRRRPSAERQVDLRLQGGQDGFRDASAVASGPVGSWRLLASGGAFEDDGFREAAGSRERSARIAAERDLGPATLLLGWSRMKGRWRHPGALTAEELRLDPGAAPFNALDAHESTVDLLTARAEAALRRTTLVALAAFRDRESDTLTTGRSQYGYRVLDSQQSLTLAVEGESRLVETARRRLSVRWGAEASRDRLHPKGFATDDVSDGAIDAEALSSAADVDWDRGAIFAGCGLELGDGLAIDVSARRDAARVARHGGEHGASGLWEQTKGSRSFSGTTLRAGVGASREVASGKISWRAAWEESFLAPSAIQLFAHPGFSSNPALEPQQGAGPTAGVTFAARRFEIALDAWETRVSREIVFDEAQSRNVNAGTTRRRGAELRASWQPRDAVRVSLGHAVVDATIRGGFPEGGRFRKGARVPLVARHRLALSLELGPWRGFEARLVAQHVGSAPLSGDFDSSEPGLEPRSLVSLAISREFASIPGLSLEVSGENLLDERDPSRGIESWDDNYFTPPSPRRFTAGVAWRFR